MLPKKALTAAGNVAMTATLGVIVVSHARTSVSHAFQSFSLDGFLLGAARGY